MRIFQALRAFFRVLFNAEFASRVKTLAIEDKSKPQADLRLLALFQREGRLLDFLQEDIDGYDDAQIGAAVRAIHKGCRKVLGEYLTLQSIRSEPEGATVEVPAGFDPGAIRLIGNVRGEPPFKGSLKHHGWQVADVRLSPVPAGQNPLIVAPAEVEVR